MRYQADIPLSELELNSYGWRDKADVYKMVRLGIMRAVDAGLPYEERRRGWISELQRVRAGRVDYKYLRRVKSFIARSIEKEPKVVVVSTVDQVEEFLSQRGNKPARVLAIFGSSVTKKYLNPAVLFDVIFNRDLQMFVWIGRERTRTTSDVLGRFWGEEDDD